MTKYYGAQAKAYFFVRSPALMHVTYAIRSAMIRRPEFTSELLYSSRLYFGFAIRANGRRQNTDGIKANKYRQPCLLSMRA